LKVRAAAEEEKAKILADATRVAQQRRGEGDGAAAGIYANAVNQAPDFYAFLRTMEASRSLARKSTTMVLSADSPLFSVLLDSSHLGAGGPGGTDSAQARPRP
jgi:membrane protease subunit HflC